MKLKLRQLLTVFALIASIHSMLAQSANLSVAPAGNQIILFWPTGETNFVVQSTTNMDSTNWVTVTNSIQVTAVTVPNTSPSMFFRLYATNVGSLTNLPFITNGMALIPSGSFTIGDNLDHQSDSVPTNVTVSAFYMDIFLVTYSQWQSVYEWATNNGYDFANAGSGKAGNHPVQSIFWHDAVKWCNARSQQAGLTPVYYADTNLTQVYKTGKIDDVGANWAANGYRLPTEAEWEKAARGGLSGQRFPWGYIISESLANYVGNLSERFDVGPNGYNAAFATGDYPYTSPVGSFAANGYGLYDMAGNVLEWCWDWYDSNMGLTGMPSSSPYAGGVDPHGPPFESYGYYRVSRGGFWSDSADYCRCAFRFGLNPTAASYSTGFRCVRAY